MTSPHGWTDRAGPPPRAAGPDLPAGPPPTPCPTGQAGVNARAMSLDTLNRFYAAFQRLDGAAMQACYAPDARFDDEAFSLRGAEEIGAMWRMLTDSARAMAAGDWRLEVGPIGNASAHWEAHYRFGATDRPVHNVIDAEFTFDDQGRIASHRDRFDFWRWSRQALGAPGWLLGWSPWLRRQVRRQAAKSLARYRAQSKA